MPKAPKAPKAPKGKSTSKRMMESGFKPVLLWLTAAEHADTFRAAELSRMRATQLLLFHGLKAVKKILENNQK